MAGTVRSGPSRQPSVASTTSAFGQSSPASLATGTTPSLNSSQRFRKLVWEATIPIAVSVEGTDLAAYGASVDRTVEVYYARAPRISYLPLLLQEVRQNLLSVMLDQASLEKIKEQDYWFTYEGTPLRWHWPIGLLYDYHAVNTAPSAHRPSSQLLGSQLLGGIQSLTSSMHRQSITQQATNDGYFSPADGSVVSSAYTPPRPPIPWRLTLRVGGAPLDKLHSAPGLSNCRASFMSMVKEADFVRHGSTKRVVNLRRTEQDALWEGVVHHDFDTYWPVASKLVPNAQATTTEDSTPASLSPSRATSISSAVTGAGGPSSVDRYGTTSSQLTARPSLMQQFNESQTSLHSAAPSESNISVAESVATTGKGVPSVQTSSSIGGSGGANVHGYRSLPMRFHLVSNAPIVQEPVAPYTEDGRPTTLHAVLSALFPLLFPPTPTFAPSSSPNPPAPLAYPVIQGIRIPLEAEIPWIGSVLPSADGWIAVCIHLLADGEKL